jgi:hypothetical protein
MSRSLLACTAYGCSPAAIMSRKEAALASPLISRSAMPGSAIRTIRPGGSGDALDVTVSRTGEQESARGRIGVHGALDGR